MAILRFRPEQKEIDDEYFSLESAESIDSAEFKSFRKEFYNYQYEFGLRAKNISKELLDFYKMVARDDMTQAFHGVNDGTPLQLRKYNIDVYIDFNLSKRKAEELFDKSSKEVMLQIKSMYDDVHKLNPGYITDYPTIANGKKQNIERLFNSWKNALAVFDLWEKRDEDNYAKIAKTKDPNNADPVHCSDEIKIQLNNAKRLIEAASKGTLFDEVCVAMTANKKRTKRSI
jgi:hypothetical protein